MRAARVRRSAVVLVTVAAAATLSLTAALARPSFPPANCAHRTDAGPVGNLRARYNVVVGPLSFDGLAGYAQPPLNKRPGYWMKSGARLLAGHTVTVTITGTARLSTGFVGYGREDGRTTLADSRGSVTFTSCAAHASPTGGQPMTFWSGGFAAPPAPACIPLNFYIDHSRVPRRVVISLAAGTCPDAR
jgi:hypothetical protein